jgi:PPIC-type PPIASE domain
MKRLLKEPLLHFLLLGAAIFFVYSLISKSGGRPEPGRIVVTERQIDSMAEVFTRAWQRPPSADELAGLVRERVREDVYFREAMALGLEKDDTVIRRRLVQKMEFVLNDVAAQAEPTEAELSAYLQAHSGSFGVERRFTFQQVYLDPDKHGDHLARDTARLLAQLNRAGREADPAAQGDPFVLEHTFSELPGSEVAKQFGKDFPAKLGSILPGEWQGPVQSGYGVHLVRVIKRTEAGVPSLAEVRDAVRRELGNARRLEMNEKIYQQLLKRYHVTIEANEAR